MGAAKTSKALERNLYRYSGALGRGDFRVVAGIWKKAEGSSRLERTILEVTDVYALGLRKQWEMADHTSTPNRTRRPLSQIPWATYAAGVVLVFIVIIAILTLLGPSIGNVFSSTISGMSANHPGYQSSQDNQPAVSTPKPQITLVPGGYPQDHMIIKNGELDLLVEDTSAAIDQVTQIATDNGGYVLSSQTSLAGQARNATLTIAVRADRFETAMRRLRQSAIEVLRELSTGEDVTSEYVDLESRLRNLEATRDRIQSFLDAAKTVEEALEINKQLAEIEAEIEQVKGRMNYLSGRSAFSTITVNLQQVIEATPTPTPTLTPTPTPTPRWSLNPVIEDATETQIGLARGLLELATWLVIVPGPYCIAGGLVLWGVLVLRRKKGG
ncbi:MAG: DUF4349 domain-containing protein [Anaerolineae bacterium]|nr:DUF4349 domain-containing protein [Anaerolineae bacterium]